MDMLNIFEKLCHLANSGVDTDGFITSVTADGEARVKLGDRELVLPNKYQLSGVYDPTWAKRTLFNPLAELAHNEAITPVLNWLIKSIQFRMNVSVMLLLREILRIAATPSEQEALTPDQVEFIAKLVDIDSTVANLFEKSISELATKGSWVFINFFPKHLGEVSGMSYARTCHVSFPIYEELTGDRKFGRSTALPKGASAKLAEVLRVLFLDIAEQDAYSSGSNSRMAPYFESFIASVMKIGNILSRAQKVWPNLWPNDPRYGILDVRWLDVLRNTDAIADEIRAIPGAVAQRVNEPQQQHQQSQRQPTVPQRQTQRQQSQYGNQRQQSFNQPQQRNNNGTVVVTMEDLARRRRELTGDSYQFNDRNDYRGNNNHFNQNYRGGRSDSGFIS
jgi:hypothetical protein